MSLFGFWDLTRSYVDTRTLTNGGLKPTAVWLKPVATTLLREDGFQIAVVGKRSKHTMGKDLHAPDPQRTNMALEPHLFIQIMKHLDPLGRVYAFRFGLCGASASFRVSAAEGLAV